MTNIDATIENPRGLPQGFMRVGPLMNLPALINELGGDAQRLFAGAGFELAQFTDPDTVIPFVPASQLLARCVKGSGCDHLGLLLGKRTCPSSLGIAGYMLSAAPNVRAALLGLVQHLDLHERGGVTAIQSDDRITRLSYSIHLSAVEAAEQINDLSMAVACQIMRSLCGSTWNPTTVMLSRERPQAMTCYRQFFQAPLHFNAGQSALTFPTALLNQSNTSADALLYRYLEKEASNIHAQQDTSCTADLRLLLQQSLLSHQCEASFIAQQLGMHERTLNRRLSEQGTTFRKVLDEVRYDKARQLLANPRVSASHVAEVLNYGDMTAFSRAFKRWSGLSPSRWRARLHPRKN